MTTAAYFRALQVEGSRNSRLEPPSDGSSGNGVLSQPECRYGKIVQNITRLKFKMVGIVFDDMEVIHRIHIIFRV